MTKTTLKFILFIIAIGIAVFPSLSYAEDSIQISFPQIQEKLDLQNPTFKGTSLYPNSDLTLYIDDSRVRNAMTDIEGKWEIYLPEAENLGEGIHIARVEARDLVKNQTKSSATIEFKIEKPKQIMASGTFLDRHPVVGSVWTFLKEFFKFYF